MTMGVQIPVIAEKPLAVFGSRKFQLDVMGDHLCTCTSHSGTKKTHDWVVEQLGDLFRTTHHTKIQDKSLNEVDVDKIRKYHVDCDNSPPHTVSFMSAIASKSGRLHSEFIRLLFLQTHRETDRFFQLQSSVCLIH